jgi:hypothetical protein
MFTAGYSAKMTEKDQQGVSAFEDFAEGDLLAVGGGEGEGRGGGVEVHEVIGNWRLEIGDFQMRMRFAQMRR